MIQGAIRTRLAFPLDYPTLTEAERGAALVCESAGLLKVGLELFVREGPAAIGIGRKLGCEIFLDLKLHDIPETVDRAVGSAAQLGVRLLTVHASGGPKMLEAAARRAEREATGLQVVAVTVLTSLDAADLQAVGVIDAPAEQALRLARLVQQVGLSGVVCSVAEAAALRAVLGPRAVLITPGIRPGGRQGTDDQKRVGTPKAAIAAGSDVLVVGRPIRDAADPAAAARGVLNEIAEALGETLRA